MLHVGFLLMACSACFPTASRTSRPGMAPPTVNWAHPQQASIKKTHHRLPTGQSSRAIFSTEVLTSQMTSLWQVDIRTSQHSFLIFLSGHFPYHLFSCSNKAAILDPQFHHSLTASVSWSHSQKNQSCCLRLSLFRKRTNYRSLNRCVLGQGKH